MVYNLNILRPDDDSMTYFSYALRYGKPIIRIRQEGHLWWKRYDVFWNADPTGLRLPNEEEEQFKIEMRRLISNYEDGKEKRYGEEKFSGGAMYGFTDYVTKVGSEVIAYWLDTFFREKKSKF